MAGVEKSKKLINQCCVIKQQQFLFCLCMYFVYVCILTRKKHNIVISYKHDVVMVLSMCNTMFYYDIKGQALA